MTVHVRFESWYIYLPSSAKQQREMTKFYVFWRTRTAMANFSVSSFEIERVSFKTDRRTEHIHRVATFEGKYKFVLLQGGVVPAVAVVIAKTSLRSSVRPRVLPITCTGHGTRRQQLIQEQNKLYL